MYVFSGTIRAPNIVSRQAFYCEDAMGWWFVLPRRRVGIQNGHWHWALALALAPPLTFTTELVIGRPM